MIFGKLKNADNVLKVDEFNAQLSSNDSKVIISNIIQNSKISCLYSDDTNNAYRIDHATNYLSRQDIATANFSLAAITSLGEGAAAVGEGQYKLFAGKAGDAGLYASVDGLTWEQINLPTIGTDNLNQRIFSVIAYVNGKYVLAAMNGTYYYTTELSNDATKWCSAGKTLQGAGYTTLSSLQQINPIKVIDEHHFVIYGSSSVGGCCYVTDFDTLTAIGVDGAANKVNDIAKVSDSRWIVVTNNGVYYTTNNITNAWSRKDNITGISAPNAWQWLTVYHDADNNVIYLGGDGGDANNDKRKTDIWYSTDGGDSYQHANFVDRASNELRGVGKIFKCKTLDNNKVLVALTSKNSTVYIFKSADGANWTTADNLVYDSPNCNFMRYSTLVTASYGNDEIIAFDGSKLMTYFADGYDKKNIAVTEYVDNNLSDKATTTYVDNAIDTRAATSHTFRNMLSASNNTNSLCILLNEPLAKSQTEVKTYVDPEYNKDRFSQNFTGVRVYLSNFFDEETIRNCTNIEITNVTLGAWNSFTGNAAIMKVLDSSNNCLGKSLPNTAAASTDDPISFEFEEPAIIPADVNYIKCILYHANNQSQIYFGAARAYKHADNHTYGTYSQNTENLVSDQYTSVKTIQYYGIVKTTCTQEIANYPRSNITIDSKVFKPVLFSGTYADASSTPFSFYMLSAAS